MNTDDNPLVNCDEGPDAQVRFMAAYMESLDNEGDSVVLTMSPGSNEQGQAGFVINFGERTYGFTLEELAEMAVVMAQESHTEEDKKKRDHMLAFARSTQMTLQMYRMVASMKEALGVDNATPDKAE